MFLESTLGLNVFQNSNLQYVFCVTFHFLKMLYKYQDSIILMEKQGMKI